MKLIAVLLASLFAAASAHATGYMMEASEKGVPCNEMRSSPEQFIASLPAFFLQSEIATKRIEFPSGVNYAIEIRPLAPKGQTGEFMATNCQRFRAGLLKHHPGKYD